MIGIKVVRGSFLHPTTTYTYRHRCRNNNNNITTTTRGKVFYMCKSKPKEDSDPENPPNKPQGDPRKQELLAKIVMLQTQKLRLTDYLDERSAYLTQFAEEANAEMEAIGENALKDLDEASARIMENIESKMQEFEESSEISKQEIENSQKELEDFEGQIESDRNEGLFFQNLRQRPPVDKAKAQQEMKKINNVTKQSAASKTRRNIYLALTGLLAIGIVDSFVSSSPNWRKVAVLGAILIGLLTQLIYEQNLLSESKNDGDENKGQEN